MSNSISSAGAVPDAAYGSSQRSPAEAAPASTGAESTVATPDPADLRLVIEEDQQAGCYVYKTVDRRSGKVVQQLPREQLLKLREAASYTAGAVIKARA